MKTEFKYKKILKHSFDKAQTDGLESDLTELFRAKSNDNSFHSASHDGWFHRRVVSLETFVGRMAELAPELQITSRRVLDFTETPAKALLITVGDEELLVRNTSTSPQTVASAHADNLAFLKEANGALLAISQRVVQNAPDTFEKVSDQLSRNEVNLHVNLKSLLARAYRANLRAGLRNVDMGAPKSALNLDS